MVIRQMLTEKQKQIIRLLLTNKEGYNVNQIARILNISVSWTHETLRLLEREGILMSKKIANSIFFKVNWENPKAEKICDFVIIDEESKNKDLKAEKEVLGTNIEENKLYNTNNAPADNNVYSLSKSQNIKTESPYRQAVISQNSFSYSVVPAGKQGVNNILFSYAALGAFGNTNSPYASSSYSNTNVPPGTLGSMLTSNISGFTLSNHTSSHKNASVPGCRYCGPEIKIPF